jgi:hypothetical protein
MCGVLQRRALWTYLNTPFLYTQERCTKEEIGSIEVEGEARRLRGDLCSDPHAMPWPRTPRSQRHAASLLFTGVSPVRGSIAPSR